ncbi:MAG: ATP-binding cassette domain-containing protein [Candidatus Thermoplasmatota archaeon]|nr:ATP-binding cassette domain-containing protein [Candidatus Thermoplasmatota archaeon]
MAEPILELDNVTVRRGMGIVLRDFSLKVNAGECVVLHGENGIGKSTVIETAARLLPLESGSVKHNGIVICDGEGRRNNPAKPFGLTLQANCLVPSQTIQQQLDNVIALSDKSFEIKPIIESYKIGNRRNDKIAHLSGGQQRKVAVISGLIPGMVSQESRLILLDEPDSGLDDDSIEILVKQIHMLRNLGHGIVIASHNKRLRECATSLHDLSEATNQTPDFTEVWQVDSVDKNYSLLRTKIGWNLNFTTLVSIQRNWLAALLVMGGLLSIADPLTLSDRDVILMGFTLAPAFTMGLVGDPVFKILSEQRAIDWWRAQNNSVPNSYLESIISGFLITAIAMQIFIQSVDYRIILAGGGIVLSTSFVVRFLQMSTIRLPRSNAVFIRLLTPILILPWGIIVDYCSKL